MIKRKSLRISSKDKILLKWIESASKGEANMAKVKYLMKQAILSYIRDRKFIEVGRIHYDPSNKVEYNPIDMVLWVKDSELIVGWLESLTKKRINSGAAIREILRKSITVVPNSEEEWIPEYFDFDDYRVNLEEVPLLTIGYSSSDDMNVEKRSESPYTSSNFETIKDVVSQKEKEVSVRVEQKKLPDSIVVNKPEKASGRRKASGLSGIRMKKE